MRGWITAVVAMAVAAAAVCGGAVRAQAGDEAIVDTAFALFSPVDTRRAQARAAIAARGNTDAVAALILALRYARIDEEALNETLQAVTGETMRGGWHEWMIWHERHPEIRAFEGFDRLISAVVSRHDPSFAGLLYPGVRHEIRLGEIAWGGVALDGIPSLDNPKLIAASEAGYLNGDDLVFGVAINGDARAYPLRIMDWHEMFNDVVGGVPVALAYCTLCGSGILYETHAEGRAAPFVFGSSGFLYRSNKLMFDRETRSLWNQFTGRPVVGPLTGSGIVLKTRPVAITTWARWREANPSTQVLSPDTGHARDYAPGAAYASYFSSPDLMFPAAVDETTLKAKDYVFALRGLDHQKAWPLKMFEGGRVINDTAGVVAVTLIGDAATRTVRAYRTAGEAFGPGPTPDTVVLDGARWTVGEAGLVASDGRTHPRLPGHIAFWFAWNGYMGANGELAGELSGAPR